MSDETDTREPAVEDVVSLAETQQPKMDAAEALDALIDAITCKDVDTALVEKAVQQTIHQYRNKLRVSAIGIANVSLKRVIRLIDILDTMDEELLSENRIRMLDDKEFAKTYAVVQTSLMQALQFVQRTADMQLDISGMDLNSTGAQEVDEDEAEVKLLSPAKRNRIRSIVQVLANLDIEDKEK